ERRDVVGVLAFLEVLVLGVGRVERALDLRGALGRGGRRAQAEHDESRCGEAPAARRRLEAVHHLPPSDRLKLYLAENWIRTSSDVKPSRKFSRLPHWISGPSITFGAGWYRMFASAYWPFLKASAAW